MNTEELKKGCTLAAQSAQAGIDWARSHPDLVTTSPDQLRRDLARAQDFAETLLRAVNNPMCVGVFGASQAGKSYLIEALSRGSEQTLSVNLGGKKYDFLEAINPVGGKEATGLVTRFSIAPTNAPAAYPVAVRLLSPIDLVKIFANSYFLDFDANEENIPDEQQLRVALDQARNLAEARTSNADKLRDRDIDNLRLYLEQRFRARRSWDVLVQVGYWQQLEQYAPKLSVEERLPLLAFLWGQLDRFTELYKQLYTVLRQLEFDDKVYCASDSLLPREDSMINADQLRELGSASAKEIAVQNSNGTSVTIAQPLLTAVVAELILQIDHLPFDFFQHTDLLDFPGARSRHNFKNAEQTLAVAENLSETLLRGKVAYLFERYTANFSLNGLLLCVVPGNQEVRTLSDYVAPWIESVHGKSASMRINQPVALFLALTKFDMRFEEKKGGQNSWQDALHTSIVDLFGQSGDWVSNWVPNSCFNNVYWIRNPAAIARGLMQYDDQDTEIGLLDADRIQSFKSDYLQTELVRKHIADPEQAFDEALSLNDGGVRYLAQRLSAICSPELKDKQLQQRLSTLLADIKSKLQTYYIDPDGGEQQRKQRLAASLQASKALITTSKTGRFGHLLAMLCLSPEELMIVIGGRLTPHESKSSDAQLNPFDQNDDQNYHDLLGDIFDDIEPPDNQHEQSDQGPHTQIARIVLDYWLEKLRSWQNDYKAGKYLRLEAETAAAIVQELQDGAHTFKLEQKIATAIASISQTVESGLTARYKPAIVAADIINNFTMKLGQNLLAPEQRASNRAGGKVFEHGQRVDSLTKLPKLDHPFAVQYLADWLRAFTALTNMNTNNQGQRSANSEANKSLGAILSKLN